MNRNTGSVNTLIVEYGFASNSEDTLKILNNWKNYAQAVTKGILKYLNKDYEKSYEEILIENNNMKEKLFKIKNIL